MDSRDGGVIRIIIFVIVGYLFNTPFPLRYPIHILSLPLFSSFFFLLRSTNRFPSHRGTEFNRQIKLGVWILQLPDIGISFEFSAGRSWKRHLSVFVQVEEELWVANLIGQHKINKDENGNAPIRYEAILLGLEKVGQFAVDKKATVHMPRIGCGLAGGTWDKLEPLINKSLLENEVETYVDVSIFLCKRSAFSL